MARFGLFEMSDNQVPWHEFTADGISLEGEYIKVLTKDSKGESITIAVLKMSDKYFVRETEMTNPRSRGSATHSENAGPPA